VDLSVVVGGDYLIHELEEFLGASALKAVIQHFAGGDIQHREQVRGPTPQDLQAYPASEKP
jgi:hypothetical protein